jgi:hypothetical protein
MWEFDTVWREKATFREDDFTGLGRLALRILAYTHSLNDNAGAVMRENSKLRRVARALLFALLMAFPLGLGGLLGGDYLWSRFGPRATDADETAAYLCGLLVGGFMAVGGGVVIVWKFWPRASPKPWQASGKINSE